MPAKSLHQWLDFISETHPSEIEMGLERIKRVFTQLPIQTTQAKLVLVAGTNGKGSTIAMIEASMLALGYSVGVYTSPHILTYNERVRVNAIDVSDEELINAFETVELARQKTALTYFEYGTLAALDILFSNNLDVILLEVGLGGRLDAVNIIYPDLSIITSVGLDHIDWLGDTVEKIGIEKAGILRQKGLFIAGENLPDTVHHISDDLSCQRFICRNDFNFYNDKEQINTHLIHSNKSLIFKGFPQSLLPENNILVALQSTLCLFNLLSPFKVFSQSSFDLVNQVIESIKIPGRLEHVIHDDHHDVFLDVGHNPHAAIYLKEFLMQYADSDTLIQIVYSSLSDKDVLGVFQHLSLVADRCLVTQLSCDRAMHVDDLASLALESGFNYIEKYSDINEAFNSALNYPDKLNDKSQRNVITLILGSFFMVEAAKRFLKTYD